MLGCQNYSQKISSFQEIVTLVEELLETCLPLPQYRPSELKKIQRGKFPFRDVNILSLVNWTVFCKKKQAAQKIF